MLAKGKIAARSAFVGLLAGFRWSAAPAAPGALLAKWTALQREAATLNLAR